MSLAGIAATSFFAGALAPGGHSKTQQIQQDFQRLGQDLGARNLSGAQSDFESLQQDLPANSAPAFQHHLRRNPQDPDLSQGGMAQILGDLGQSLQSGNVSAAQRSYATLLQDFESYAPGGTGVVNASA